MKTAILGYGKSGKSAEKLLKKMGINNIHIYDDKLTDFPEINKVTDEYDIYVVSPGIDINNLGINKNKITSEIDLAYNLLERESKIIAVTGTNGKSTITYLTAQILNNYGVKAKACGNIGFAFGEAVIEGYDVYVVELSSFQIDLIKYFRADASCISNVTDDHFDRYGNFENYLKSKIKIKDITKGQLFSLNSECLVNKLPESTVFIDENLKNFPVFEDNKLRFENFYVSLDNFNLYGWHNKINLAFSLSLSSSLFDFFGDMTHLIENLTGLEHRCEFVGAINETIYINDSKGTNVDSTMVALKSVNEDCILILGGYDKGGDFGELAALINEKVKKVILYGAAAAKIENQLLGRVNAEIISVYSLKDAVENAYQNSENIKYVLFSPGCASFDQFKNFEERGEYFKKYVNEIKEKIG